MAQERFTQDGVVYETLPNGNVRVVGYADAPSTPAQQPQPIVIGTPNPKMPGELTLQRQQIEQNQRQAHSQELSDKARALENQKLEQQIQQGAANTSGSAEVRQKAINAFNSSYLLDNAIAEMEAQYQKYFAKTKGVAGAADYLNFEGRQNFDAAANRARGPAIQSLGFTSSQSNTPLETQMNIGAYIPTSGDFDSTIEQKIAQLRQLRDTSRAQAIATLGGVPDKNGKITPVDANGPPAFPSERREQPGVPNVTPGSGGPTGGTGGGGGNGGPGTDRFGMPLANISGPQQLQFGNGNGPPQAGARMSSADDSAYRQAIAAGDFGQALSIVERNFGKQDARSAGELHAVIDYHHAHPQADIPSVNYSRIDDAAKAAYERQQFGDNLPQALKDAQNNPSASGARGVLSGITFGAGPYIGAAGNMLTRGKSWQDAIQAARARDEADFRANAGTRIGGEIVGGAINAAGLEAGLGRLATRLPATLADIARSPRTADAIFGGVTGAINNPNDPLTGAVTGGAAGVGGGMFGRGATRAVGNVLTGVRDAGVQALRDRGIPLTVGQTLGGTAKRMEDLATSVPFVGDMIRNRRLDSLRGFNQSAFDEGMAPFGQIANPAATTTNGMIGEPGVELARAARTQAYGNTLDPVTVTADAPYLADTRGTIAAGAALPEPMRTNMAYTLPTRVGQAFDNAGNLTGRDYQQALRGLRRDARAVENQPYGYDFGQVTRRAEGDLGNLLQRQAPGVADDLATVNAGNRNVSILQDAVNAARNGSASGEGGLFTSAQLSNAASANARRFGGTQGTTQQPFFALTEAARDVLPSRVPDSGTAGRLAAMALPGLATGTGIGYAAGGQEGAGTGAGIYLGLLAALAAGGSRPAQRALTSALADRPDALVRIGGRVQQLAPVGGMFGASIPVGLLTAQ